MRERVADAPAPLQNAQTPDAFARILPARAQTSCRPSPAPATPRKGVVVVRRVRRAQVDRSKGWTGLITAEGEELARLREESRELRTEDTSQETYIPGRIRTSGSEG